MAKLAVLVIATMTLVTVGCGNGTSTTSDSTSASSPANAPTTGTAEITIKNFAFAPPNASIKAGTTVTFSNQDNQPHTATADDGSFDAGTIAAGASTTHRFDSATTIKYHCSFHPFMTATITVS